MGGGPGGKGSSSILLTQEGEEPLLDCNFKNPSSQDNDTQSDDLGVNYVDDQLSFNKFDDLGHSDSLISCDFESLPRRRRHRVFKEVMQSYNNLQMRIGSLQEAKDKIVSYKPGAWIEEVGGLEVTDYDLPKTTTLMLVGPRGSGKSSLVNRILRVFEEDKYRSGKAQVTYSSVGDGTYFLQEYIISGGSTSFCLYDTRSLSEKASDNFEMLKNWMTRGVRHGQLIIRDSDTSCVKKSMKCKARHASNCSRETRMVNFVVFVVNGLSVLQSMDGGDSSQNTDLLAKTFSYPYLSFKDDKPVVVITHGDLLSQNDRVRIRLHLGESLGIPPATQIFDIPETYDASTELTIVDMLRCSLEHADRNLPHKQWSLNKVFKALDLSIVIYLFIIVLVIMISLHIHASKNNISWKWFHLQEHTSEVHRSWYEIRHFWHPQADPTVAAASAPVLSSKTTMANEGIADEIIVQMGTSGNQIL